MNIVLIYIKVTQKGAEKFMKRHLLTILVLFGLLAFANAGWSLTINSGAIDVGAKDLFRDSALLPNSGDQTEINWVNSVLGTSFTTMDKYDVEAPNWTAVDSSPGIWALDLKDDPMYILVKIGTGSLPQGTHDHYLFENLAEFGWAVIAFSDLNISDINVSRISHVGEFGTTPVPEPSTMFLLGSGLLGLVGYGRKKFFKK